MVAVVVVLDMAAVKLVDEFDVVITIDSKVFEMLLHKDLS